MLFANAFFGIELQINFLVLPELSYENIIVENFDILDLRVILRNELYISGVNVGILQVLLWLDAFGF